MKPKYTPIVLPIIFSLILVAICVLGVYALIIRTTIVPGAQTQAQIPTFTEIQQMLVEKGYKIKVDGVIGTETLKAWDAELCNQQASKMFKKMAGESK